jgi:hypothetical protein
MKIFKLLLLFVSINAFAQNTQTIKLNFVNQQTKLPIEGVNVQITKHTLSGTTDGNGNVRFDNVPLGRFEIEASSVEYGRHIFKELLLEHSRQFVLTLELQPSSQELEAIQVNSGSTRNSALMSVESITNEQIMRFPATFFDPARLTMTFAGVANTNDQANNISVRGNSPDFVQWRLEGVEIVNPNHLNNAGTFSDKPAAVGGGTNILSAQMLGRMDFLSGAFPAAGYANALSGVFDMNLRNGNNEKYQHVVQAGLLGIDLSSEGPISKKTGSSYLFNYRYSFTGLLSQAGVNFGGESITFQDVAFTLNFPTKKLGTFTLFGMGGSSSNEFTPDEDKANWETSKDLSSVDYNGRMGLLGVKHNIKLFKDWNLHTVVVNSAQESLRNQFSGNENIDYDYSARNYTSFNVSASGNLGKLFGVNAGVSGSHQFYKFNFINSDARFYSIDNTLIQPYVKVSNRYKSRFNYNIGFISPYYSLSGSQYIEPRLAANYQLSAKHQVKAAYGLHSQGVTNRTVFEQMDYKPYRAHHFTLGYQFDLDEKQSFYTEVFYQNLFNLVTFDSVYVSTLNGTEIGNFRNGVYYLDQKNQGRNYGIELNYKRYLDKGFFALANATFYKSQFKAFDNKFYNTRFAGDYIYNLTLGKEWENGTGRILGVNGRVNWVGGFRDYNIRYLDVEQVRYVYFDAGNPLLVKYDDYFRVDLRAYIKRTKKRGSETISLDLQNATNRKNAGQNYYDIYLNQIVQRKQMGLIPMINYRWEF